MGEHDPFVASPVKIGEDHTPIFGRERNCPLRSRSLDEKNCQANGYWKTQAVALFANGQSPTIFEDASEHGSILREH
jgi:hypothetical protein